MHQSLRTSLLVTIQTSCLGCKGMVAPYCSSMSSIVLLHCIPQCCNAAMHAVYNRCVHKKALQRPSVIQCLSGQVPTWSDKGHPTVAAAGGRPVHPSTSSETSLVVLPAILMV